MRSIDNERIERELFLRATLPALNGEVAARLSEALKPLEVRAGSVLFQAGEAARAFYFIVDGQIAMEQTGKATWRFGSRSVVGILDTLMNRARTRRAWAITDSRLLVLDSGLWFDLLEDDPLLARGITVNIAHQGHELWLSLTSGSVSPAGAASEVRSASSLPLVEKIITLNDSSLFRLAGAQAVASLAHFAEEIRLGAGATLFEAGTVDATLFVVSSGAIELQHAQRQVQVRFGPSQVVGAAAALAGELSAYAAHAVGGAVVLRIRDEDYYDQAEEHPDLIRGALAYLALEREALLELEPPRADEPDAATRASRASTGP